MTGPTEIEPGRRLGASVGAVAAGFVATFVLSVATDAALHAAGVFPPLGQRMADGLFVLATAYRTAYTVAGGWLTARLAPRRPMRHALVLAAIGVVAATAGLLATWSRSDLGPRWYPIALVVLAVPSIWAGARLFTSSAGRGEGRGAGGRATGDTALEP